MCIEKIKFSKLFKFKTNSNSRLCRNFHNLKFQSQLQSYLFLYLLLNLHQIYSMINLSYFLTPHPCCHQKNILYLNLLLDRLLTLLQKFQNPRYCRQLNHLAGHNFLNHSRHSLKHLILDRSFEHQILQCTYYVPF